MATLNAVNTSLSGQTGTGSFAGSTSPSFTTPILGEAAATSINKVIFTAPATSSTLTIADGKALTASNTLTFTGTDSSSVAFGTGGTVAYTPSPGVLGRATIAGTSQAASVNMKYFALAAGQTTLTLPGTYAVGDVIALIGSTANTGGWIIATAAGDTVRVNNATTSAGGTVTSAAVAGQTIYLECDVANSSWIMTSTVSTTLTTS